MSKTAVLSTILANQIGWFIDNDAPLTLINPDVPNSDNVNYFIPLVYGPRNVIMTQRVTVVDFVGSPSDVFFSKADTWEKQWEKLTSTIGVSNLPWEMFNDYATEVYLRVIKYLDPVASENISFENRLEQFYNGLANTRGYGEEVIDEDLIETVAGSAG